MPSILSNGRSKNKPEYLRRIGGAVKIAGLSACLVSFAGAGAQYRVDAWTTDDGLPQNSVTGLTRTSDGYLWLTTNDGLVRFDGARFTVFNKTNTPAITTNRLVGAFSDKSGRLWFQSEDGGIFYYERGVFFVALRPNEIPALLRSPFFDDQAGGVIFYANHINYRYQDGRFVPLKIDGLPEDSVIILADREGGLWFSNKAGVYRVLSGAVKTYRLDGFGENEIYKIGYEDRDGGIWLGYGGEIDRPSDSKVLRIKNDRIRSFSFPAAAVWHFAEDAAGDLWMSVYNKGIYKIDRRALAADEALDEAIKPLAALAGISVNTSGTLCPDGEGGMWIGTEQGLVRIVPQTIRVYSKKDGLPEENVYPIFEDRAGAVWAGIWRHSLVKYENGGFKTYLKDIDAALITSLFEDRTGRFWFGNIGALRYLEKGRPVKFNGPAGFPEVTEFSVISEDTDGNLWFGTDRGLSRYAGGRATVFTTGEGLPDNYVVAFLQTRNGRIWVGTRGGIASIENGTVKAFTVADGLASNYIRSLYEDADGALWIGSYDGGLTRYKDGRFARFTKSDGLFSNGVFCILEDDRGWFWMNSNQGIYRVSRQELNDFAEGKTKSLTSIAYNQQDGLLNIEGNGGRQPAGIRARDGKLWFPTAEGIAVIDPETVATNLLPPPVIIESVVIDRNELGNEEYQAAIGNRQTPIELAPGRSNLEINYTGLSFINSEQVKFKYRLDGLDEDWQDVGTRRTAYYSYLPAGDYTFRVIAANRDGVWNTAGASVIIRVLPPFYRTAWFIALGCLIFVGAGWMIYRTRVGRLKKARFAQEEFSRGLINAHETERRRIAAELHDSLGQSLAMIKNRAVFNSQTFRDPQTAREQFEQISNQSAEAISEVREIAFNLRPYLLDRLGLTKAIRAMLDKCAETGALEITSAIDDLDGIFSNEAEMSIYRILQESLSNILKHSEASRAKVEIGKTGRLLSIRIEDNGKGFDANSKKDGEKRGFGLLGMSERIKLLGGTQTIDSEIGRGTIVRINLNLPAGEGK